MRVLHAPVNIAGQASILAQAQKELGIKSDVLVFDQNKFNYNCDVNLSLSGRTLVGKCITLAFNFIKCLFNYDIFHFHFGSSLLPYNLDLPVLRLFGKKTVMNYWGSDIRQSDIAIDYVYFETPDELQKIYPEKDNVKKREKIETVRKYVNLTIAGDYPLLPYSPDSAVIKQAIDLTRFPFIGCENRSEKVKIVHAPTDREKKGTKYVLVAIERLKAEKYDVDFVLIENETNDYVSEACKNADIIIDQLVLESHGIFPIETMAMGKPVLCRIDEKILKYYPGLPIIRTDPDNIYVNLKLLIENPDLRKEIGEKGRKYVEEVHDSKKIAKQLIRLYKSI